MSGIYVIQIYEYICYQVYISSQVPQLQLEVGWRTWLLHQSKQFYSFIVHKVILYPSRNPFKAHVTRSERPVTIGHKTIRHLDVIGAQWPSFWDSNYSGYSTGDRVWRYPNLFPVRVLIFGIIFFGTGSSTFIGTKFFRLWYNFFSSTNQTNGKFSGTGTKFPGNLRYL